MTLSKFSLPSVRYYIATVIFHIIWVMSRMTLGRLSLLLSSVRQLAYNLPNLSKCQGLHHSNCVCHILLMFQQMTLGKISLLFNYCIFLCRYFQNLSWRYVSCQLCLSLTSVMQYGTQAKLVICSDLLLFTLVVEACPSVKFYII